MTGLVTLPQVTTYEIDEVAEIPRFRARVRRSFPIEGYDDTVYIPPIGVEGEVARAGNHYLFFPDGAISKSDDIIFSEVDYGDLELIHDCADGANGEDH